MSTGHTLAGLLLAGCLFHFCFVAAVDGASVKLAASAGRALFQLNNPGLTAITEHTTELVTLGGTLQVVHIHMADNSTDNTYLLVISDTDVKQLRFTSPLLGAFTTGDKVAITYDPADDAIVDGLPTIIARSMRRINTNSRTLGRAATNITSITFILAPCKQAAAVSVANLKKKYFNEYAGGNDDTLQNFFAGCSMGAATFTSAANVIVGPIPIGCSGSNNGLNWNANQCEVLPDVYGWGYAAEQYVTKHMPNIKLKQYKHRIMVLPKNSPCPWAGLGNLGCGDSCYVWIKGDMAGYTNAFTHELGHNLFLDHSGKGSDEYTDDTSAMGYCCARRCYSSPQMYQLGWAAPVADLNAASLTRQQTYTVVGRVTQPTNFLRVVPDWKGPTSNGLYISLLSPTSVDQYLDKTYRGQLVVQSWAGSAKTLQISKTKQLALISPGGQWTDASSGLRVQYQAAMGNSATVTVCAVRQSTETTCDDGIDNDCDGLVDSEDPDCGGSGAPARDPQYDNGTVKSVSVCGNGVCERTKGESAAICPRDCPAVCGDKFCDKLRQETAKACPADCPARCGDDYCDAKRGESVRTCSHDCSGSCGDKYCNAARGENPVTCAKDCPSRCGDGFCHYQGGESAKSCPGDCKPKCGDKFCDSSRGESARTCIADCPAVKPVISRCGDGKCTKPQETAANCPGDCPAVCGDGFCDSKRKESRSSCAKDCKGWCGDSVCNGKGGETMYNCPADCWTANCGDGWCDYYSGENPSVCPVDCAQDAKGKCGDGKCNYYRGESAMTCPTDCPAVCFDGFCDRQRGETAKSCPADCQNSFTQVADGAIPICGDNSCNPLTENFATCAADCKPECGDGTCNEPFENSLTCPKDCVVGCGNNICESTETELSCPADCCKRASVCGDDRCDAFTENCMNCPYDCARSNEDGFCCGKGQGCGNEACSSDNSLCTETCWSTEPVQMAY